MVLVPKKYNALNSKIEQVYTAADSDHFQMAVLPTLYELVSSDCCGYIGIDHTNQQPFGHLQESPVEMRAFPGSFNMQHTGRNFCLYASQYPTTGHPKKIQNRRPLTMSVLRHWKALHLHKLHNKYYRQMGFEYQISFLFMVSEGYWVGFNLNRRKKDFSAQDRLLIKLLRPHIDRAYRTALVRRKFQCERSTLEKYIEKKGEGIIEVSLDGSIQFVTAFARQLLAIYFGPTDNSLTRLPHPVQELVEELLILRKQGCEQEPFIFEKGGRELNIEFLPVKGADHQPLLLLKEVVSQVSSAVKLGGAYDLTQREGEVMRWLAEGKTNKEISAILVIQLPTVRKHLEHIYGKLA